MAADDTKYNAHNVGNPVVHFGAAVKTWLDDFNEAAEGTRPHKHWEQSKAPSSREWEG